MRKSYPTRIHIHENVAISDETVIESADFGKADISIGKDTIIGPFVVIEAMDHIYKDARTPIAKQGHVYGHITIGADVWIGAHVTILRGSVIPDGCVIGACSLVTRHHTLEPYCVYVGNPLRKIGKRT